LCNFLHSPVISCPLGPNILLSTLLSNTLSLCSSSFLVLNILIGSEIPNVCVVFSLTSTGQYSVIFQSRDIQSGRKSSRNYLRPHL
jgi:hypothetical protein